MKTDAIELEKRVAELKQQIDEREDRVEQLEQAAKSLETTYEFIYEFNHHGHTAVRLGRCRTHLEVAQAVLQHRDPHHDRNEQMAVYAFLCKNPFSTGDAALQYAARNDINVSFPHPADEIKDAAESPVVFYIGFSTDVVGRLYNHIGGRGTIFTQVFRPDKILDIQWFEDEASARQTERVFAEQLDELNPKAYIGGGR